VIFWYLNALRTLIVTLFYMLSIGQPFAPCERVWDNDAGPVPPGKTYEEWYGSFALMCPNRAHDGRTVIFCYGSNCWPSLLTPHFPFATKARWISSPPP
jgi:hypothetical protein